MAAGRRGSINITNLIIKIISTLLQLLLLLPACSPALGQWLNHIFLYFLNSNYVLKLFTILVPSQGRYIPFFANIILSKLNIFFRIFIQLFRLKIYSFILSVFVANCNKIFKVNKKYWNFFLENIGLDSKTNTTTQRNVFQKTKIYF